MEGLSLLKNAAIDRVSNAVAAGTTDINSTGVDMAGFDSVLFSVAFGTITSTAVTSVQIDHSDDNSSWNAVEGSKVSIPDTDSNKVVVVECVRPTKRYVRCTVDRGTANAVVDGITACRTLARKVPTSQGSTVSGSKVIVGSTTGTP